MWKFVRTEGEANRERKSGPTLSEPESVGHPEILAQSFFLQFRSGVPPATREATTAAGQTCKELPKLYSSRCCSTARRKVRSSNRAFGRRRHAHVIRAFAWLIEVYGRGS